MKSGFDSRGFSLLEALVALSMIGLLVAIAIPMYRGYLEKAYAKACLAERDSANKMILLYCSETTNTPLENLAQLVSAGTIKVLPQCPQGGEYVLIPGDENSGYPAVGCSLHYWPEGETPSPSPGLAGMWLMDEGNGSFVGSNPTQGTVIHADWTDGKVGSALRFEGVTKGLDDYVQIPDYKTLNLSDQGTLQAWIYPESTRPYGGIIHKGNRNDFSDEAYSMQYYGGKLALGVTDENGTYWRLQTNVSPTKGNWTHVAATWGDDGMKLYVDGQLVSGTLFQSPDGSKWTRAPNPAQVVVARVTNGDVHIGAQLDQSYNSSLRNMGFHGKIDEVMIYKSNLLAEAIQKYYESTR